MQIGFVFADLEDAQEFEPVDERKGTRLPHFSFLVLTS